MRSAHAWQTGGVRRSMASDWQSMAMDEGRRLSSGRRHRARDGKALRRRITRSALTHAARRRAMRCQGARPGSMSRPCLSSPMRSWSDSQRPCRAVPRCASTRPRRTARSRCTTAATRSRCVPQSLVSSGFPASMRVLPRVLSACSQGQRKVVQQLAARCERAGRTARRRHCEEAAMRSKARVSQRVVAACDACLDSASRMSSHRCVRHRNARASDGVIFWNFFLNITDQTNYDSP